MPEGTQPTDGQQGNPPSGDGGKPPESGPKSPKTFTQEELDSIVEARLRRAIPPDYEELKALKVAKDAAAEAEKTELQKARDTATTATKERDEAITRANATLVQAAIIREATEAKAADTDIVIALLAGNDTISVADGKVKGAKEAVAKLLKDKPLLVGQTGRSSGGEFNGVDNKTIAEKIVELERTGKHAEARELKIQQFAGLGK